ncbi:MAG: HPr family phosphocarrier protein [Lachnospiraceae bacterium]|nr:HPr family phosphocarrier protein [Lachnospiraceae bacterium]
MVSERIVIENHMGLHLRPAGELCKKAMEYESKIMIHFRDREFNAKSVLGVLSACIQQSDEIELVCSGPDEVEALKALVEVLREE